MADFYFFTDIESIQTDCNVDDFGSISNSIFNTGEKYTIAANAKLYAPLKGYVFCQYTDQGTLNLLIKPLTIFHSPNGPVNYFVFKNLKIDSFVDPQTKKIVPKTRTDLSKVIWENHEAQLLDNNTSLVDPNEAILGLHFNSTTNDSNYISNNESIQSVLDYSFSTPPVVINQGQYLGDFIGGSQNAIIEVIVDNQFNEYLIKDFRTNTSQFIVDSNIITSNYSLFEKKEKEKVLLYICYSSLINLMYMTGHSNIKVFSQNNGKSDISDVFNKLTQSSRIQLNLFGILGRSLGFHDLYFQEFKLRSFQNTTDFKVFSLNNLAISEHWPILTFDISTHNNYISSYSSTHFIRLEIDNPPYSMYAYNSADIDKINKKFKSFTNLFDDKGILEIPIFHEKNQKKHIFQPVIQFGTIEALNLTDDIYKLYRSKHFYLNNILKFKPKFQLDIKISNLNSLQSIENKRSKGIDLFNICEGISKNVDSYTFFQYPSSNYLSTNNLINNKRFRFNNFTTNNCEHVLLYLNNVISNTSLRNIDFIDEIGNVKESVFLDSCLGVDTEFIFDTKLFNCFELEKTDVDNIKNLIQQNQLSWEMDLYLYIEETENSKKINNHITFSELEIKIGGYKLVSNEYEFTSLSTQISIQTINTLN